jgi:hypothetical protein
MTSSTSYFNIYRVASVLSRLIHASFVTCKRLVVPVPDLEFKDGALLCSCLVDPIYYG